MPTKRGGLTAATHGSNDVYVFGGEHPFNDGKPLRTFDGKEIYHPKTDLRITITHSKAWAYRQTFGSSSYQSASCSRICPKFKRVINSISNGRAGISEDKCQPVFMSFSFTGIGGAAVDVSLMDCLETLFK